MGLLDQAASDMAALYSLDEIGQAITYTPAGGTPISCTGIFTPGENLDDAQWKTALQASAILRVLKTDVPTWTQRDSVVIDTVTWEVVKAMSETPGDWKLELRRDVRPTFNR
ncbi:MAG: hypothetical protein WC372_08815 [Candidatus Neomarinimicrobiota bacterium]|jgi:hypothetical protein